MATRPAAKVVKETILTVVEGWLVVSGEGELLELLERSQRVK